MKRSVCLITVIIMLLTCLSTAVSAEELTEEDSGQMNLDVVFVLDSSGSMNESDPNRVAVDAFSLFTDLCDESCSLGYTVYSEKIKESEEITPLDKKHLASLRDKITSLNTNPYGDTDIALGLTKAMSLHQANKDTRENRKKAIILLSDGNTHLIGGSRTVAESQKELDTTLQKLNESNIPVYAIGLNYDGTLDKKETQKIASKTQGKAYETKSSEELPAIIADIFGDICEITGTRRPIVDGNVEINIKDKSVFYVNIVIRSRFTVNELNPVLLNPRREKVALTDNDKVKMTSTDSYVLIKLIYPQDGRWKLQLENATDENCVVTQIDFYSIYLTQNIPQTAVSGQAVRLSASLNEKSGIVSDIDLLDTIKMTATVRCSDKEDQQVELVRQPDNTFAGEFVPESTGTYLIFSTATSEKFTKDSTTFSLTVKSQPDSAIADGNGSGGGGLLPEADGQLRDDFQGSITTIIIVLVIAVIVTFVLILLFAKLREKREQQALSLMRAEPDAPPLPERPAPPAPPIEKVKEGPKPTDPDYVDIPLVEHGSLESLIKRGSDNAFNANADDYEADASLEALIKKGPDNNLGIGSVSTEDVPEFEAPVDDSYQSGHNLSDMLGSLDDGGVDLNKY